MRAIGNLEEVGGEMAEPLTAAELAAKDGKGNEA